MKGWLKGKKREVRMLRMQFLAAARITKNECLDIKILISGYGLVLDGLLLRLWLRLMCFSKSLFKGDYSIFLVMYQILFFTNGLFQLSLAPLHYWIMFLQIILLFYDFTTVLCFLQCYIPICLEHSKRLIHFTE